MPAPEAQIITLSPAEAGEVLTLQRAAFALDCAVNYPGYTLPVTQTLTELREEMENSEARTLGIRDGHRLVAAVRMRRAEPGAVYLGRLSVAPDREREGLGGTLMAAAHETAAREFPGATRTTLSVEGDNDRLVSWYRRLGYVITQRGTENSEFEWRMERPLS